MEMKDQFVICIIDEQIEIDVVWKTQQGPNKNTCTHESNHNEILKNTRNQLREWRDRSRMRLVLPAQTLLRATIRRLIIGRSLRLCGWLKGKTRRIKTRRRSSSRRMATMMFLELKYDI